MPPAPTDHGHTVYRPRLYRLSRGDDRAAVDDLRLRGVIREQHDTYRTQLGELIETRAPARTFGPGELEAEVAARLDGRDPAAEGVWAWFPWSGRLVHLLAADEFAELRTSRNRYKITAEEQAALAARRVGIVGLSVGQAVAVTMALERCAGFFRLADFDRLALSNLNRLRAAVHEIDVPKAVITARQIAETDPYLGVDCNLDGLDDRNLDAFFDEGGRLDLVIDECDDLPMKFALRRAARQRGIPVLMDTSDRGLLDIERFDLEPTRPLFHGRVAEPPAESLRALDKEELVPYVADIIGRDTLSARATASLFEVGQTIRTWPQLASAVALGGGASCDAARRILLGQMRSSGRFYVDVESIVADGQGRHTAPLEQPTRDSAAGGGPPPLPPRPVNLAEIVAAAVTAPSGGNCQPWRFVADGSRLWVLLDRGRAESLLDFEGTAAVAAIGAATENAVLAAHAGGKEVALTFAPPAAPYPDCMALLDLAGEPTETHEFDDLYAAVAERHTNRVVGERRELPAEAAAALRAAAESVPGVRLQLATDPSALEEIGAVLGEGDRVRFLDRRLHAEMMGEVRWSPAEARETGDGIDIDTLELSAADRVGIQLCRSWPAMQMLQRFGGGRALAKASKRAVAAAAAVGLVSVAGTGAADFFAGGRAMQRVWLTATARGLAVQPLSSLPYLFARLVRGGGQGLPDHQRAELGRLRTRYERLFDVGPAVGEVLLMRFAFAKPAAARALRRPLGEVLRAIGDDPAP